MRIKTRYKCLKNFTMWEEEHVSFEDHPFLRELNILIQNSLFNKIHNDLIKNNIHIIDIEIDDDEYLNQLKELDWVISDVLDQPNGVSIHTNIIIKETPHHDYLDLIRFIPKIIDSESENEINAIK